MSDPREPARWRELNGELPQDVVAGLHAYAHEGPTPAQHAQMRAALVAKLSTDSAVANVGQAPRSAAPILKRVGAALGLCTALVWAGSHLQVSKAPPPAIATPPAQPALPPPVAVEPSAREAAPTPPPRPAGVDEPAPAAEKVAARAAHRARAQRSVVDPEAELALLKRARRALASAPAQALALTDEHARSHAEGMFVQERELIAIEALVRGQRGQEAALRGAQFRARFPRSAHLERLRIVLEQR